MSNLSTICHVVSGDLWGGAEAQVFELSRCLTDRGYRVFVITLNKGDLFYKLCDIQVDVTALEEGKMSALMMMFKMWLFFRRNNIGLVHCHGFKENFIAGIAGKTKISCKIVRTHHGRGVVGGSPVKALIERLNAILLTDKLIAVSHELKAYLQELGYPSYKIEVVHNGIDCQKLTTSKDASEVLEALSISKDSIIIGTASRIEKEKGHQYLLLALKELIDEGLPVVAVIVGDGKLLHKYQSMAQEMDLDNAVIFTGFKDDVTNYLNIFDIFVLMSLNEGIPLALIEAMCMGKPVVCSEVGGVPEVVTSNINGILVPSQDYRSCANACRIILNQKELRASLSKHARKHVVENFSSIKSTAATINLYKKILEN